MKRKKGIKAFVLGILLITILVSPVNVFGLSANISIEVFYNNINLVIDGGPVSFGNDSSGKKIQPFIYNGTTYLPVRAVGEAVDKEVHWDDTTNTIYLEDKSNDANSDVKEDNSSTTDTTTSATKATKDTINVFYKNIKLVVDKKLVSFGNDSTGKKIEPFIYNGTTYLPVRAVGEAIGKEVHWDDGTKTVYLGKNQKPNSLDGTKVTIDDFSINLGNGKSLSINDTPETIISILGEDSIEKTLLGPSPDQYGIENFLYLKDGLRVSYNVYHRHYDFAIRNIDNIDITNPKYTTYRGLRVGDSYDKVIQLYGNPWSIENLEDWDWDCDVYYYFDEENPTNGMLSIYIEDNKVIRINM